MTEQQQQTDLAQQLEAQNAILERIAFSTHATRVTLAWLTGLFIAGIVLSLIVAFT
jgi:hypothetical protein